MRALNRYILQDFLVIFGLTLLIITFVLCIGVVLRAIDLAARGISGGLIAQVFFLNVPYMLTFSIPMSVLTATLLLFGRLSFDGELTAMKASGLSMWQIIAPVVLVSVLLSFLCVWISATVAPKCRHAVRNLLVQIGVDEPVNLLEPGRFVRDFPNLMVYVGARDGNELKDVVVYEMGENGPQRNVRAATGRLTVDKEAKAMIVDLYEVRIDQVERDPDTGVAKSRYINAQHYPVRLEYAKFVRSGARKKTSDMTIRELGLAIRDVRTVFPELKEEDVTRQRMRLVVEANKRLALSLSCFAFTLIAIPLGMKSKRKESTVGIGLSLLLVFFFYLFIILANGLVEYPHLRPDLIVWLPVILAEVAGFFLIKRTN